MKRFMFVNIAILIGLLSIFTSTVAAKEETPALVIQQIRGPESCCHAGSTEMISEINSVSENTQLPLSWAIRFDALTDQKTLEKIKTIPKSQSLGLLLEITPQLASASGVVYKGEPDGSDWYNGRNTFLIGYAQADRKKLVDVIFNKFKNEFGYYPTFTVSWMIDSWSLNYLQENYGVELHEITKEQYETDSYTLYGGIFNAPYYPTLNHPLIPASSVAEKLDLVMVRQTWSDIERNYGSFFTYFTSQPNDYLQNPKATGTDYFNTLLEQAIFQKDQGMIVIGLENSQEWISFKEEYQNQLVLLQKKQAEGKIKIYSPHDFAVKFKNEVPENIPRILISPEFPQSETGVLWYFGRTYRARIQNIQNKLVLTDLRIFSPLTDPYKDKPVSVSRAYWIIPYLFDGSQQYTLKSKPAGPDIYAGHPVRSDSEVEPFGMILGSADGKFSREKDTVTIESSDGQVKLEPDFMTTTVSNSGFTVPVNLTFADLLNSNSSQYVNFPKHPRFFMSPNKNLSTIDLGWETQDLENIILAKLEKSESSWKITPQKLTDIDANKLAPIFQPDLSNLPFDPTASVFYWHNTTAIAGRNPVRLYVVPLSVLGRAVKINSFSVQLDQPDYITAQVPPLLETVFEPFFVDFTATQSASSRVSFTAGGTIIPGDTALQFYTDCQKELMTCFQNRDELKGFVGLLVQEKITFYSKQIKQLAQKAKWEMEKIWLKLF